MEMILLSSRFSSTKSNDTSYKATSAYLNSILPVSCYFTDREPPSYDEFRLNDESKNKTCDEIACQRDEAIQQRDQFKLEAEELRQQLCKVQAEYIELLKKSAQH